MKYMLLIYDNANTRETFLGAEGEALMAEVDAIMKELTESGEFVGGEALADPSNTKTIRVVDGAPAVTDGPYAEAKEYLGGFRIVDCESPERAVEIAARWPSARFSPSRCGRSWTRPARRCERAATTTRTCCAALAPQVLGALVRRYGHFDACEDAVQEALLAAAVQWPERGRARRTRAAGSSRSPRAG